MWRDGARAVRRKSVRRRRVGRGEGDGVVDGMFGRGSGFVRVVKKFHFSFGVRTCDERFARGFGKLESHELEVVAVLSETGLSVR